jgi:predicted regulator of Ras-like GTPase activity (Roadblock/LC7/MglB family)
MRRALAAGTLCALALTACSGTVQPRDHGTVLEIVVEGDRVEPDGRRVEVAAGEPVTLEIESDRPAELHVHSSPEQVLEVEAGTSSLTLVIDRPGIVDVEEHETGLVVVQLEVR